MSIVMHPAVKQQLLQINKFLPHALLLAGKEGVGLATIARSIAKEQGVTPSIMLPVKNDAIDLEKGAITIEVIRDLYNDTRTKQRGKRIIIIDYAERMTVQAQNAFLKLLEEPTESTHFILASHAPDKLLPTVLSRVARLDVRTITKEQSHEFLDLLVKVPPQKHAQILFLGEGLPAEIQRLVESDAYFEERVNIMRDARDLLQADTYQKLLLAHSYKDSRERALALLADATKIVRRTISSQASTELTARLDALLRARELLQANGSIRTVLTQFVLQ